MIFNSNVCQYLALLETQAYYISQFPKNSSQNGIKYSSFFFFRGKTSVTAHTATTDFYSVKMKDISIV